MNEKRKEKSFKKSLYLLQFAFNIFLLKALKKNWFELNHKKD